MTQQKTNLVISGINLTDGGALSVYLDCVKELLNNGYDEKYNIILLVSNKKLFPEDPRVRYIEFKKSKKNWLYRLYYEYIYFKSFSKKLGVDIWISLHDMTPNVVANKRYVYCHNPSPFNKMKFSEAKYGWKYYLFSKFYKYLYKINIKKNNAVIVQQDWMREEFKKMFQIDNVIVARPSIPTVSTPISDESKASNKAIFIAPSFPRYFKNFQVVCRAARLLKEKSIDNFEVIITVDGTENEYSKELVQAFGAIKNIVFSGILPREELFKIYSKANCLVFMSKLETWGMPIIEFKPTGKSMILADLPYTHETVGDYNDVSFVSVDDYKQLAIQMKKVIDNKKLGSSKLEVPKQPYASDWDELFRLIL